MSRRSLAPLVVVGALVLAAAALFAFNASRGVHVAKTLGELAIGLAVLAALLVPVAVMEGAAARRFERLEERLRHERPEDAVSPVRTPEGEGFVFRTGDSEVFLLRPPGFVGPAVFVDGSGVRHLVREPADLPLFQGVGERPQP